VRLTFPKFLGVVLLMLVLLVVGFFLIVVSYDSWLLQEMVVGRRRDLRRLVTFAANPTEFVLRSLFLASLGFVLFSTGLLFLAALVTRFLAFRTRFFKETAQPRLSIWFFAPLFLSFAVWFALLFILPTFYG